MCKLGDIIVIKYIGDDHKEFSKHSFVVINDKPGFIEGFKYELINLFILIKIKLIIAF